MALWSIHLVDVIILKHSNDVLSLEFLGNNVIGPLRILSSLASMREHGVRDAAPPAATCSSRTTDSKTFNSYFDGMIFRIAVWIDLHL